MCFSVTAVLSAVTVTVTVTLTVKVTVTVTVTASMTISCASCPAAMQLLGKLPGVYRFDLTVAVAIGQQSAAALQHASVSLASATYFVLKMKRVGCMPNSAWHMCLAPRLTSTAFEMSPKVPTSADLKNRKHHLMQKHMHTSPHQSQLVMRTYLGSPV